MNITEKKTHSLTLVQAVKDALHTILSDDPSALIMGEDVGKNGGVFRATDGLQAAFGEDRVIDTPLSESGIVGTAFGLAVAGLKPIVEIQFLGFIYPAYEQIMTHVSRIRSKSMGHYTAPIVIRAPYGAGVRAPEIHSDSTEALFTHMPGIKVVCPSTPYDAKGLLIAAAEDPDPVLFLEPMRTYRSSRMDVPIEKYTLQIGKGRIRKEGSDVTLIAWGAMLPIVTTAASMAEKIGISCEVVDLLTLSPIDSDLIAQSIQKTGRGVIVHEAQANGGLGNDLIGIINDTSFLYLKAPIARVTGFDVPVPFFSLEDYFLPTPERILHAITDVMSF